MMIKAISLLFVVMLAAYGQTAQTRSTLEGTYFADGQAEGSITPARMRDFVRSIVPESKTQGYFLTFGSGGLPVAAANPMTYPSAGVPLSNGTAWGTSYAVGLLAGNLIVLDENGALPAVSAANLTNFPTLNQNTTGTAAGLTAAYIDWNAGSGGNSILNKPTLTNGDIVGTSGAGVPTANCTAGKAVYINTTTGDPYVCTAANTWKRILATDDDGLAVIAFLEGTAPGAGAASGEHNLYFDSADSRLKSHENGGSVVTYHSTANPQTTITGNAATATALAANGANCSSGQAPLGVDASGAVENCFAVATAASTDTLTNKTLDAEGTGNVITIPTKMWLPAAGCNGTTGALLWDTLATVAPTAVCSAGTTNTNMMRGVAAFPDSNGAYSIQQTLMLPSDWTGNIDLLIRYRTVETTGNTVWQAHVACVADGEVHDVAYNTLTASAADAAKPTTLQVNDVAITNLPTTGCAAGELMHLRVVRDREHENDNITGVVSLIGVEVTMRRAM
jgi:hypothetical protein